MTHDPLEDYEPAPPLAEQIRPYRKYGDTELALALLAFGKREAMTLPALKPADAEERSPFDVPSQPATAGADYHCPECDTEVRLVYRPDNASCPACGAPPSALALGRYRMDE
jgi:rubrerythrin